MFTTKIYVYVVGLYIYVNKTLVGIRDFFPIGFALILRFGENVIVFVFYLSEKKKKRKQNLSSFFFIHSRVWLALCKKANSFVQVFLPFELEIRFFCWLSGTKTIKYSSYLLGTL